MEDGQAKDLLRARVGEDLYEDGAAEYLVVALDCLPLAIVQAPESRVFCGMAGRAITMFWFTSSSAHHSKTYSNTVTVVSP